ncbi:Cellulose binding domain-containing protein [Micromonospora purpureochromogenes]|uniref:Cellulose binding domain-containing protein n=1 Tax=Micromonospora purpureochromogenes TaxID=47872 RepID=A0A1C4XFJ2_9ACTN|nr:cellulose binding domain-containing protein [Micromonospora purpureochromogenes]SCF07156.1 Cellulose binding domain-containing protein [Micromonospora purpureochromogenes]
MSGTRRRAPRGATALASSPWVVVATGVVVMVILLVVALTASRSREPGTGARPGDLPATVALPDLPSESPSQAAVALPAPVVPGLSPRRSDPPVPTPDGGPASAAGGAGAQPGPVPSPPAPPPSPVTGRYRVMEAFDGGFIGEVLLANAAARPRPWTVRLVPPAGSRLVTSWVEGAPQGSARMSDGVFTYTSGVDLDGGASVPLRFHIEHNGGDIRPSGCTVDGTACAGL